MSLVSQITLLAQKCAQEDYANAQAAAGALTAAQAAQATADSAVATAGAAFHYKGTVAGVASLPSSGNTEGDVYNVGSDLNGGNYVWNGTAWDSLGQVFQVASSLTSTSSNDLVPEGLVVTALNTKQDASDIGDTTHDFVADYTAAYSAAGA